METARLEHVNVTVENPVKMAKDLNHLFGWTVRWEGASLNNGYTVLVGGESSYLALYSPPEMTGEPVSPYTAPAALNHIGIQVEDLDSMRNKIEDFGLIITDENENAPGRRIYFDLHNVEFEVLQY